MRSSRLIISAAVAVAMGGFGLMGCQSDNDAARHADSGAYDSQRLHAHAASGSPSVGAGSGSGGSSVYPDANPASIRTSGDTSAAEGPGGAATGATGAGAAATGANTAATNNGAATDTDGNASGLTGTGDSRTTGTSRRVPPVTPSGR